MSNDRQTQTDYFAPLRRAITVILLLGLFGLFILWRIDSPRVEKFRALVIDTFVPSFEWMLRPMTSVVKLAQDYQSYEKLLKQNKELRRELQQMKSWKEAALQLEQENARLLDLNQLRVDSKLTHVSGIVIADSGSPFRQSVLLNIGSRDGIQDGWAAMDGLGLVGRISGVGSSTSRVILLTDTASQIPVIIQPSGQRAILMGDNSFAPPVEFIENVDLVRPGGDADRGVYGIRRPVSQTQGRTLTQTGFAQSRRPAYSISDHHRAHSTCCMSPHGGKPPRSPSPTRFWPGSPVTAAFICRRAGRASTPPRSPDSRGRPMPRWRSASSAR